MLISSFCSPWGNRTPLARMKILSTNRYTNGPSSLHPRVSLSFVDAKVGQIFGTTKFFTGKCKKKALNILQLLQILGNIFVLQLIIHQVAGKILVV